MEGVECEVGCLEHKSQEERTLSVVCCVVLCCGLWCVRGSVILLSHSLASSND